MQILTSRLTDWNLKSHRPICHLCMRQQRGTKSSRKVKLRCPSKAHLPGVREPRTILLYNGSTFFLKECVHIASRYWLHPSLVKWRKWVVVDSLQQVSIWGLKKKTLRTSSKPTPIKWHNPGWIRTGSKAAKDSHWDKESFPCQEALAVTQRRPQMSQFSHFQHLLVRHPRLWLWEKRISHGTDPELWSWDGDRLPGLVIMMKDQELLEKI